MIRYLQRRLSYRMRLLTTFVIPWLLTTLFSFAYLTHVQRETGEANARQHLGIVSDMLAYSVGTGLSEGNFSLVQKAFDWSRIDDNVSYIGILDEKNDFIYQTASRPPMATSLLLQQGPGVSATASGLLSVAPVVVGGKALGRVVLLYSLDGVERSIRSAQTTSIVVSLLVLLLGLWGSRLLARQAAALESARADAERQAETVRAQADVLSAMNSNLKHSNAQLHATQSDLQEAHDDLERRVEERTNALAEANTELQLNQAHLGVAMMAARMFPWKIDLPSGKLAVTDDLLELIGETSTRSATLLSHVHAADRKGAFFALARAVKTLEPLEVEFRVLRSTGEVRWFVSYGRALTDPAGMATHVVGINMDITDRKRSESELRTSLKEKEILLKEVHHRVKNNMQIISSLLFLQSNFVRDAYDVQLFRESQQRVKSMAMVHERLYRSGDLSSIDFGDYVQTIVRELVSSYHRDGLELRTAIDHVRFGVDTAIPCGLLINELVTNAIKHAFPGDRTGLIEVAASQEAGQLLLSVSDNGIGMPETVDFTEAETLGVTLVRALAEQLDGSIAIGRDHGTRITVTFPLDDDATQAPPA